MRRPDPGPALLSRFGASRRGNVAIIFSLTLIPLVFLGGAALDYSGAASLKSKLQSATDGANLQLCLMGGIPTQAQLDAAAQTNMTGYMGATSFTIVSVVPTNNPRLITLNTRSDFSTAVMRAMNSSFRTMRVEATATCSNQQQSYEIALALDNTGSMNQSGGGTSKMQAAKTAAVNFVNAVYADPSMATTTKISLVPFASAVAVPTSYRTASWVDTLGTASYHWNFVLGGAVTGAYYQANYGIRGRFEVIDYLKTKAAGWGDWNGCFESRPYPLNVQDTAPVSSNLNSYYVPMLAPDESGNAGVHQHTDGSGAQVNAANSYIDDVPTGCTLTDETNRTGNACKYLYLNTVTAKTTATVGSPSPYVSVGQPVGPNAYCTTRPLTRLSTNQPTLISEINAMTANGSTNIHEGFLWGWRTLSPTAVFTDGAAYSTQFNHKIIVLMTDGTNQWLSNPSNVLKSVYSAYGFFKNPDGTTANSRLMPANANPTTDQNGRDAIDALTLEACKNARNAGVVIYTIGFSVPGYEIDAQGIKLLQDCSNNSTQSFIASDATAIDSVFQQIQKSIGRLRLAK